jgi:outer membrane protein assembly factor BamB
MRRRPGVVEPGRVYLHFGSYGTFCLDTETYEIIWQRRDITLQPLARASLLDRDVGGQTHSNDGGSRPAVSHLP